MARLFNSTDSIHFGSDSSIDNLAQNTITCMVWLFPTTGSMGTARIIEKRASGCSASGFIFMMQNTSTMRSQTLNGSVQANQVGSNNQITVSVWSSVLFEYDASGDKRANLFVNASEISYGTDTAGSLNPSSEASGNMVLGQESCGTTRTFVGNMAIVAVWAAILTAIEKTSIDHGVHPIAIRNSLLKLLAPLNGNNDPEPDYINQINQGILSGVTKSVTNPPVQFLSRWLSMC